jgi:homoserine O-succinyltransferase
MAIVEHSSLPAFWTIESEGYVVVSPEEARSSSLVDLKIGLLNLMPDAALRATDRQFLRLLAAGSDEFDIWIHPFTAAAEWRGDDAAWHVEEHYTTFEDVQRLGIDALIVTGANPAEHRLEREHFWEELGEVLDWASEATQSVLCSWFGPASRRRGGASTSTIVSLNIPCWKVSVTLWRPPTPIGTT